MTGGNAGGMAPRLGSIPVTTVTNRAALKSSAWPTQTST
jgi:hypothetical protein